MPTVYYQQKLNFIYFDVVSNNLRRLDLFNKNTKVVVIDPTVFVPAGIYTEGQVIAQQVVFNTSYLYPASKQLDTAWISAGWNLTSDATFLAQLKTWANNNLDIGSLIAPMGYNLKMSRIEYAPSIIATYDNIGLISYSYNNTTGVVTYGVGANLSGVSIGNYFRDGIDIYYLVTGVNPATRQVTIRNRIDGTIPSSIAEVVNENFDGSIYDNFETPPPSFYTMAFFYMGNQGSIL
jgi:hypothetical protein